MKQILYLEDDPLILQNYSELLTDAGYSVISISSYDECLKSINKCKSDLYLLDIGIDDNEFAGFDICRMVNSLYPHAPVIFLSAKQVSDLAVQMKKCRAEEFISKDLPIELIINTVDKVLQHSPR